MRHSLDCSVNVPAWPALPCDCGAAEEAKHEVMTATINETNAERLAALLPDKHRPRFESGAAMRMES